MIRTIGRMALRASAAALMTATATAAMAQVNGSAPAYGCPTGAGTATTCVNGGGSSLAAYVYSAPAASKFSGGELTVEALATGGHTGYSYEKASSGAGQQAFEENNPVPLGATADNYSVHFAASDSFISSSSVLFPFVGPGKPLASGGQFIQVPMIITPITIPVNNSKITHNGAITLTDNDLCGIFSGLITNWNKTSVSSLVTPGTIHVYYREDNAGSGTSFLLTQHLAKVCTAKNTLTGVVFAANSKFAKLFIGVPGVTVTGPTSSTDTTTPWTISGTPVANFVGAKGSGGVADGVNNDSTGSALGYVSPDYTSIANTPATTTAAKPYTQLYVAALKNATNGLAYLPTVVNTLYGYNHPGSSAVHGTPPALNSKATAAVQTNWVPQIPLPSAGYPILGTTNWLVAQCYASPAVGSAIAVAIKNNLTGAFNTLLQNNGFVPIPGGTTSGWGKAVLDTFILNAYGLNLNIDNATACHGVTGR